jgi:outer membrane murein-binding lipoprotein Lpp
MWSRIVAFILGPIGMWLAIVAIATAAIGGAYAYGYTRGSNKAEVRQLEATVDQLRRVIEHREAATSADNAQREIDRAELERLDEINRNLTNELANASRECLDGPSTDRLRGLWGQAR